MSARPDIITLCTVAFSVDTYSANLRSGFFFSFYSIDVFCTLRRLFVRFGLYSGFRLLCNRYRRAVHVHSLFLFGRESLPVVGPQIKIPCLLKFVRAIIMRI